MLDYIDFSEILLRISAETTAAGMHGFLCGQICAHGSPSEELWQEFMDLQGNDDDSVNNACYEMQMMVQEIIESLKAPEMDFYLLLPEDETSLKERALALADWCHGFLNGLGLGMGQIRRSLSEDSNEMLSDFTKICQISVEDDAEDDEVAFMELTEYVRVGAMMLFDEFNTSALSDYQSETVH